MVTLALLDGRLAAQLQANPSARSGIEIVVQASSCEQLLAQATRGVQVLVVNLGHLGDEPKATLSRLTRVLKPELSLVIYYFEKRSVIARLADAQTRTMRGPVHLDALRAQITALLVRDKLARAGEGS